MAAKRHKPEDIVTKLRQVEVLVGHSNMLRLVVGFGPQQPFAALYKNDRGAGPSNVCADSGRPANGPDRPLAVTWDVAARPGKPVVRSSLSIPGPVVLVEQKSRVFAATVRYPES